MELSVIMQTLHYFLAIHVNDTAVHDNRTFIHQHYSSLYQALNTDSDNTSCPFGVPCFDLEYPWISENRSIVLPPQSLHIIRPSLILYTQRNGVQDLDLFNYTIISESGLNKESHLVIATHGFLHSGSTTLMKKMVSTFLEYGIENDPNLSIIIVDWKIGSRLPYAQAVANTRIVGMYVGAAVQILSEVTGVQLKNVHLVGHSLGAHLMGYAGHFVRQTTSGDLIGRITGMDPAGPYFRGTPTEIRLDDTDAGFVVNIHTDSTSIIKVLPESLGISEPSGHLDFYPDGGGFQNGCKKSQSILDPSEAVYKTLNFVACSHEKSFDYIVNSIVKKCLYIGVECDSWDSFLRGNCWGCDDRPCYTMGYNVHKFPIPDNESAMLQITKGRRKLFLATPADDVCGVQIRVKIFITESKQMRLQGQSINFKIFLRGTHRHNMLKPPSWLRTVRIKSNLTMQWTEAILDPGEPKFVLFSFKPVTNLFGFKYNMSLNLAYVSIDILSSKSYTFKVCNGPISASEPRMIRKGTC